MTALLVIAGIYGLGAAFVFLGLGALVLGYVAMGDGSNADTRYGLRHSSVLALGWPYYAIIACPLLA